MTKVNKNTNVYGLKYFILVNTRIKMDYKIEYPGPVYIGQTFKL